MDYRYNRKLGAIVLVLALILGTLIGVKNGMLAGGNSSSGSGLYYDDSAAVLGNKATTAIEDFNGLGKGTLLVKTVNGTGYSNCYDYTLDLAEDLADEGRLSYETGMLLVLDISGGDYSFVYGSELSNLDLSYRYLLDTYVEPSFSKGKYDQAIVDFCNGLDSTLSKVSYYSESSGPSAFSVILVIIIIILLIAMFSQPTRRTRRTSYRRGSMVPPPPPPRTNRSYGSSYSPPRSSSGSRYGSSSSYSSGTRSSFSGGSRTSSSSSRSSFSGGSRSSFSSSSSSRSSSSSSRSSFSGGSRSSSSSSRSSFSGGSRGGFSGRK